jgi:hypothetical protein
MPDDQSIDPLRSFLGFRFRHIFSAQSRVPLIGRPVNYLSMMVSPILPDSWPIEIPSSKSWNSWWSVKANPQIDAGRFTKYSLARYLGACGRVLVAEGDVVALSDQLTRDLALRSELALQVGERQKHQLSTLLANITNWKEAVTESNSLALKFYFLPYRYKFFLRSNGVQYGHHMYRNKQPYFTQRLVENYLLFIILNPIQEEKNVQQQWIPRNIPRLIYSWKSFLSCIVTNYLILLDWHTGLNITGNLSQSIKKIHS